MTTLLAPRHAVKTTRRAASRRAATGPALARALFKALRRLESLIPEFHSCGVPYSEDRLDFIDEAWTPAGDAVDRAEKGLLAAIRARGVAGIVAAGRLYIDLSACPEFDTIVEYRGTNVLIVALETIPDLEIGPDPADAQHWAEQSPDHHTTEETPVEVLGDGPEPDWDAMGEEALALDSYSRGVLPN